MRHVPDEVILPDLVGVRPRHAVGFGHEAVDTFDCRDGDLLEDLDRKVDFGLRRNVPLHLWPRIVSSVRRAGQGSACLDALDLVLLAPVQVVVGLNVCDRSTISRARRG